MNVKTNLLILQWPSLKAKMRKWVKEEKVLVGFCQGDWARAVNL